MRQSLVSKLFLGASLLYSATLLIACLMPAPAVILTKDNSDKVLHGSAYFVFTLLWFSYFYLFYLKNKNTRFVVGVTLLLALSYGMIIEVMQGTLTSYRSADVFDMLANVIGISVAFLLIGLLKPRFEQLKSKF